MGFSLSMLIFFPEEVTFFTSLFPHLFNAHLSLRFNIFQLCSGSSVVKNPPANAGDMGSIPKLGRSPGEGNGNPLQYSYLENSMDRGAWKATVHGVAKESDMT